MEPDGDSVWNLFHALQNPIGPRVNGNDEKKAGESLDRGSSARFMGKCFDNVMIVRN
jgi:hypothetical protein